ncbi:MAG: phage tail tape measure protein [Rhizobiales bacterium]|jgi:phage-related minor tail protein|nr:phage tail tape measure protein [Hyphomicrobiales bacterium]
MAEEPFDSSQLSDLNNSLDGLQARTASLTVSANGFASAMSRAFTQSASGGRQFDDVLKSLALRMSSLVVTAAFKPIASGITGGLNSLFGGLFGGGSGANVVAATGAVKPFAAGGVIGTPTYFPLMSGGTGLAGEAGPEAIMPLARGPDGRLGVAANGGGAGAPNVTIHIRTPDAESFRRSESYITGQIARAVARGQRSL